MPFCFSLYCASLIEITLYKHYATVRKKKIQFLPAKHSHPIMFFILQKRTWCRHRRLWKILCFLSKLPLFSFCDARTDVCGAFLTSSKNPHTVGIWGLFWPAWCRSFTCNHFSHLKSLKIYHILWCIKIRFSADFPPSWGNSSTLERKRHTGAYKSKQGHPLRFVKLHPVLSFFIPLMHFLCWFLYKPTFYLCLSQSYCKPFLSWCKNSLNCQN